MEEVFEGVYFIEDRLATRNLVPGTRVYEEKLAEIDGTEFRLWNPNRSKLSAAVLKDLKTLPIKKDTKVLYLGAGSGTTASHISDIARGGVVFCVESSPTPMEKLLTVCKKRMNMIPLLADANHPERYAFFLERVDVIYQDVAQKNQAEIFLRNSSLYLKDGGYALMAVKARSIDSVKDVDTIVATEIAKLKPQFKIKEVVDLSPYEKDHVLMVAEKRSS